MPGQHPILPPLGVDTVELEFAVRTELITGYEDPPTVGTRALEHEIDRRVVRIGGAGGEPKGLAVLLAERTDGRQLCELAVGTVTGMTHYFMEITLHLSLPGPG
jgi:hypothetical protein